VDLDTAIVDELTVPVAPLVIDPAVEQDSAPTNQQKTLRQLATHGSIWTIIGFGGSQVLRFGTNLVLARLLFPEAFGLMTIVNSVMQGLVMFSDVGIGQSIIRHVRRNDPEFYNTAWTIQVGRGILLTLIGLALAWPIGMLYDPFLTKLLTCVAFTAAIGGFSSTKIATANRDMRLGRLISVELTAHVVSVAVMVGWAWMYHSVWSLVIGGFASVFGRLILSYVAIPGPGNHFCWRSDAAAEIFHFGRWIFLSTIFTFLGFQADKLILGQLVPLDVLGVYSVAFGMMATVSLVFEQLSTRVLMPAMVHVSKSNAARFANLVLLSRKVLLMAAAVAVADLVLLAPAVFRLLYDQRYADATWMTQLLACGLWFTLLQRSGEASLLATDRSRALAAANCMNFILTVIGAPIGFFLFGIPGFIAGWSLGNFAAVVVLDMELVREGVPAVRQDILMTVYVVALVATGFTLQQVWRQHITDGKFVYVADVLTAIALSIFGAIAIFIRNRSFAFVRASAS
jgi:O-antigen/teichoic acid export membrane protein